LIDKVKIARSFSRSASTYDQVAYFQREVGSTLLNCLSQSVGYETFQVGAGGEERERYCLDVGCGTAYFKDKIENNFPSVQYIGLDLAEGMLGHVSYKESPTEPLLICADAEHLPLSAGSVDLLFSNMALQWCENVPLLLKEADRVLSNDGFFAFTTLGPKTLLELKSAWKKVDDLVHVNQFLTLDRWSNDINNSGFVVEQSHQEKMVLKYDSVTTLLQELKLLGAHNVNDGQRQTLTGPKRLQKLLAAYEFDEAEQCYPATYDVYYWVLKKTS